MGAMNEAEPDAFETAAEVVADPVQTTNFDEAKEALAARGRERGFVSSEDLLEGLPVDDLTTEQVEEFMTQIEEHLRNEGIEVIEVPGEDITEDLKAVVRDDDVLKAPTNDPV